jgi:hypothetical protein
MNTQVAVGPILSRVLDIYKRRAGLLLGMAALVLIPAGLIDGIFQAIGGFLGSLGSLIQLVATAVYAGAVVRVVQAENSGGEPGSIGEIFGSIADRIWPLVWVAFVSSILVGLGLILLIIPGVVLLVWWSVYQPAIVVEGRAWDSLASSRALVKGNGWSVFGLALLLMILVLLTSAVSLSLGALIGGAFGIALVGILLGIFLIPIDGLVRSVLYFTLAAKGAESGAGGQVQPTESGSGPVAFG